MNITMKEQLSVLKNQMFKEEEVQENKLDKIEHINKLMGRYADNKLTYQDKEVKIEVNTNDKKEVKKGQLWYVDFGKRQGNLQSGIRPALVDSNDINNRFSNIINVYPLTSKMTKASNIPVHVTIEGFNLKEKSVILIEQDTPIDVRYQLLTYIGTVDELILKKVEKARNIQRGILTEKTPLEKLSTNIQNEIQVQLEKIRNCEKVLADTKTQSLITHLLSERGDLLYSLQIYCEDNKLNYRDFYVMYKKEEEVKVM